MYFTKNRLYTPGEKSAGFLYEDMNVLCKFRELQQNAKCTQMGTQSKQQGKVLVCVFTLGCVYILYVGVGVSLGSKWQFK